MNKELALQCKKEAFERIRHAHKMQELKLERENLDKSMKVIEKGIEYKKVIN